MIPLKSLLVPLDFSRHSDYALDHALALAQIFGARIHLLHGYHFAMIATPDHVIYGDLLRTVRGRAARNLDKALQRVRTAGVGGETHLAEMPPGQAIVETARKIDPDLIVMGTRGWTGLKHVLLGSVADRTIRTAPCPVMTVQADRAASGPFRLRTVLVPTDFSDCSGRALALARGLIEEVESARLVLIHAYFLPPESKTLGDREHESLLGEISQRATEELDRVSANLREKGVPVEFAVEYGTPETVVVDVATERGADLIVMGTHGRTGLPQVLLGSVAERVVRTAPCPVVTVKPD